MRAARAVSAVRYVCRRIQNHAAPTAAAIAASSRTIQRFGRSGDGGSSFDGAGAAASDDARWNTRGRFVIYAANFATMNTLIAFLTENCCQGKGACLPACNPARTVKTSKRRITA